VDGFWGKSSCITAMAMLLVFGGCKAQAPNRVQGYMEGEFVYVASPRAGRLESMHVQPRRPIGNSSPNTARPC
jgi:HlyD family secretion protein